MSKEKLNKVAEGTLPGYTGTDGPVTFVTWKKVMEHDANTVVEMEKRFNFSRKALDRKKVLVVGCGTLGNLTVQNLILAGIPNITVVDFDNIATYNLPRSPLFRLDDVGQKKAHTLAMRAAELSPFDVEVTGIDADITRLGSGFMKGFDVVMSPVDSWSIRSYVSAMCSMLGITHISAGTAVLSDTMGTTVTIEPAGCNACYSCLVPGDITDMKKRLSCLNYKPSTQAQVAAFSSIAAGMASQLTVNCLTSKYVPRMKDGKPVAWKYVFTEFGRRDDTVNNLNTTFMSRTDDGRCIRHKDLSNMSTEIHKVTVKGKRTVSKIDTQLRKIFGPDSECALDIRRSMLYYMAYPDKTENGPGPISSFWISKRKNTKQDEELLGRLPADHIYVVSDMTSLDSVLSKLVEIRFED